MREISIFLANNYIYFIVIDAVLLFILLIFILSSKLKRRVKKSNAVETMKIDDQILSKIESNNAQSNPNNMFSNNDIIIK